MKARRSVSASAEGVIAPSGPATRWARWTAAPRGSRGRRVATISAPPSRISVLTNIFENAGCARSEAGSSSTISPYEVTSMVLSDPERLRSVRRRPSALPSVAAMTSIRLSMALAVLKNSALWSENTTEDRSSRPEQGAWLADHHSPDCTSRMKRKMPPSSSVGSGDQRFSARLPSMARPAPVELMMVENCPLVISATSRSARPGSVTAVWVSPAASIEPRPSPSAEGARVTGVMSRGDFSCSSSSEARTTGSAWKRSRWMPSITVLAMAMIDIPWWWAMTLRTTAWRCRSRSRVGAKSTAS